MAIIAITESSETTTILRSRSQMVTLKRGGNIKYAPYVFTEHGAVMLANVLTSDRDDSDLRAVLKILHQLLLPLPLSPAPKRRMGFSMDKQE